MAGACSCVVSLTCFVPCPLLAQSAVRAQADRQQWYLNAGKMTYVVGVNEQGILQTLYWGPLLRDGAVVPVARSLPERASQYPPAATTPQEYPAYGAGIFPETALKVNSLNGDRTLVLHYESARVDGAKLEIVLKDTAQPLRVHLYYQAYAEGVLARWSRIENIGKGSFGIENAASATWNLPAGTGYSHRWLTGMWGGEFQLNEEPLKTGKSVQESRTGHTSHEANPWFSIGKQGETTEETGPVWFGELGWSGNWQIVTEYTSLEQPRVTGGYNPFDFHWTLAAGASLETPKFYAGYTDGGEGQASRILSQFQLQEILPKRGEAREAKPRPIIYNSWEATEMNFTADTQIALAERAAKAGVERFVIDDGWFGKRDDDHAGLGDWTVTPKKFPQGLKPIINRVHALGMDFGIWVEPEMVNPDSDLYRQHPDWAMNFPDRQRTEMRNQLMLNLARTDVKEWMFTWLDKLVSENDIAFLKWDYNRIWSEPGWNTAPGSSPEHPNPDAEKAIYLQSIRNLYEVIDRLRAKHPKLEIESCSSGGGRVDLGILERTDEVWPSDNTDALDRQDIQWGYTQAYTPQTMVAWVTDVPSMDHRMVPLQYRFVVAMQGALGIGANLTKFSDADMALSAKLTEFYKTVRTTVQQGKLYRLASPLAGDTSQMEYVADDGSQAVLLAYVHSQRFALPYAAVHLRGLDPDAMYHVHALDPDKYAGEATVSGSVLMGAGVNLKLRGDYDSTAVALERVR
ncbi:alpha-galactosidase [Acidipila sp. EB88]|nr:alpha-galactosidase [Acidipila sp. EB88]